MFDYGAGTLAIRAAVCVLEIASPRGNVFVCCGPRGLEVRPNATAWPLTLSQPDASPVLPSPGGERRMLCALIDPYG